MRVHPLVIAIGIPAIFLAVMSVLAYLEDRDVKDCAHLGGQMVRTTGGLVCAKLEVLK